MRTNNDNRINEIVYKLTYFALHGKTIFTAGNGGSAATASHMTNDFIKGCQVSHRLGVRSICLTDSIPTLTCLSNDFTYEEAIKIYLSTMAHTGDCLIVFSGSGNSENIIQVAKWANTAGIYVIGFLGNGGGRLKQYCDYSLIITNNNMEEIENVHMTCAHEVITLLRDGLRSSFGIEIINYPRKNHVFKYALFDFDGTISLIREGWQDVMIPYFVELLTDTPKGKNEDKDELYNIVKNFVDDLTGKKTLFQCIALAHEVEKRGGSPQEPLFYKQEYLKRLMEKIADRRIGLENGLIKPEDMIVPGIYEFLDMLKNSNIMLCCASGTDQVDVRYEAALLGLDKYFSKNIYGALDEMGTDDTKELVIRNLVNTEKFNGDEMLVFGDGMVEIELIKSKGGFAVAVASDEINKCGINEWKRERLIKAGADIVIPEFTGAHQLFKFIMNGEY